MNDVAVALGLAMLSTTAALAQTAPARQPPAEVASPSTVANNARVSEIVVTASRANLMGKAITASQGTVTQEEIKLRPIYRIGQVYETVPGLTVTVHSGEGKANQYLLRGFNLDHGTDFASFVDDMPVNRPTNTHGQGYSDQNFLMPQTISGIDYTKGPYYAAIGDFGAVGSAHVRLLNAMPTEISASAGTLGDEDIFTSTTHLFDAQDRIWFAGDVGHVDGPWTPAGEYNRYNLAARYSHGADAEGYSLTAMYSHGRGRLETDQSVYALREGLIGRYGTLDPTDASRSERYSLSGHYGALFDGWRFSANAYAIHSTMTLWNNFTHDLFDPVNGDQEQQDETRNTGGLDTSLARTLLFGTIRSDTVLGAQDRFDSVYVDRRHTVGRVALDYCELASVDGTSATPYPAVDDACSADRVRLNDLGVYVENTTHWLPWLRTVVGLREEDYDARDHSLTLGVRDSGDQSLFQPKGSLILGPLHQTELYLSDGRGFHSDDVRGVFETVPLEGIQNVGVKTPLMAAANGQEVGLRTNIIPMVQVQVSVFQEDFQSELAYDQDQGEDQASAPSRRRGMEMSAEFRPFPWLELNSDIAFAKARYMGSDAALAAYGLGGPYIANAPVFNGSAGILVDNLGPWFGSLQWRDLGRYPVVDGSDTPMDKGYSEFNLEVGYKVTSRLTAELGVYNLTDSHANAAAYDYTSRLAPTGAEVTGLQVHPLEPISARFTLTATF